MPAIPIRLPSTTRGATSLPSIPPLLQTPLGYALLELQGTINFPSPPTDIDDGSTEVGRLVFPDYESSSTDLGEDAEGPWMKRVWLYVGFQRMTGSVVKLGKPLAILRRRGVTDAPIDRMEVDSSRPSDIAAEELEIVEMVEWKIVFRSRPEPVGLAAD